MSEREEKSFDDAPAHYDSEQAHAWADGYNSALAARDAGAVRVLDQYTVGTKDGEPVMEYTRYEATAKQWATIFDEERADCAPHRVMRVALLNPDATPSNAAAAAGREVTGAIPKWKRDEWHSLRGQGMVSSVGEYTPSAFWELLDAYEALASERGREG